MPNWFAMEVGAQPEERPKTPTQLNRLQEEEKIEMALLAEKVESSINHVNDNEYERREEDINRNLDISKVDRNETENDKEGIEELDANDPSSSSPVKGSFRDFIFSPKAETINSSSSPLQRNQLKAMM